jgi:hypothetical protein
VNDSFQIVTDIVYNRIKSGEINILKQVIIYFMNKNCGIKIGDPGSI